MTASDFDLVVIGGGSAGVRAARVSAELGAKVALVELAKLGGTCVNVGCVPKKLLVYASEFGRAFDDARGFGWSPGEPQFDWPALIAGKDREIARLNEVYRRRLEQAGVEVITGQARLLNAHEVEVDGARLRSRFLLVATGGHSRVLNIEGHALAITSDDVFHLARLPARITVLGGGYIALEFACMFRSLGVQVTVVHRGQQILGGFDHDVREHLAAQLSKQGVVVRCETTIGAIRERDGALLAELGDGTELMSDQVLLAIGRVPRTHGLGLERVGVRLDESGAVLVDAFGRSSVENIYAAGDCTGGAALTPVAIAEGQAIAHTLFGASQVRVDRSAIPTAVFSQPPVATVGLAEHEARESGVELEVYRSVFTPLKHTLSGRDEQSMVKLLVDNTSQRVIGCHMVGADAPEIMQGLAVAMRAGATKALFDTTIGIHPTAAEEFVTLR